MALSGILFLLTAPVVCGLAVSKDYCNMDIFNASCSAGEVVMIKTALYGRMKLGTCVKKNLGYLGCVANILDILDGKCSGRSNCSFTVPSQTLYNANPCPEDTTPYLEASYECIRVTQWDRPPRRCGERKPIMLTAPSGYISSSLTSQLNLGTDRCPWRISVAPGQRIKISSFNFMRAGREDGPGLPRPGVCYEYGALVENERVAKRISLCGEEARETLQYTSSGHEVDVLVVDAQVLENLGPLLLKYQAVGCPDLPAPKGGRVSRKGENATVRCDDGHDVWYLTCKDTEWQGQMSNCSHGSPGPQTDRVTDFPMGILLVVAIGVALGVFLGGLLLVLAVVYMRRRHRRYIDEHPVPRQYYPEQKSAMIFAPHNPEEWEPSPKAMDTEDVMLRGVPSPGCRMCALPGSGMQELIPLGPPPQSDRSRHNVPQSDRCHNVTGPAECPSPPDVTSRHHIYECPKFS